MKKTHRILPLLLALLLLAGAMLTGCQKKTPEIAAPDRVAVAIFDLIIHNDAATAKDVLGYESETDVRRDLLGSDDDFYQSLTDALLEQFQEIGANVSQKDGQLLLDGFLNMMSKVRLTANVKSMDAGTGEAVVTCQVTSFPPNALNDAVTGAMLTLLADETLLTDTDALVSALIQVMADTMNELEPNGELRTFDADFTLEPMRINGVSTSVWVPVDAADFGASISNAAMGS